MQVTERVYLVGSGEFGSELSHSKDCNVYLLDGGDEYALIDAGSGLAPERIVEQIEHHGIAMDRVKHLLITHIHGDHAAGAWYFREKYGMQVIASQEGAPWLEQADLERTSLAAAMKAGVYPSDFEFHACPVDVRVSEGDTVHVGQIPITVIDTPGHARGHVSFMIEEDGKRSLFAGDTIFSGGRIVIQYIWDCSIQDYAESIAKLSELQIERLYSGHGAVVLSQGAKHIDKAHQAFLRLEIPPNL